MKKISETIVFFGNEKLATGVDKPKPLILESVKRAGFEIEKVITGSLETLGLHDSQIAVLVAYGQIIPRSVLNQFPLGIINVHPSLLPLYRGPTPIEQVILDGAAKTGVSIMRLAEAMDEGPIYKQKTIHLNGKESKEELTLQLQKLGAELLVEVLPEIVADRAKPRQQPHPDRATYCRKLMKVDGIIDWLKPAEQLEREVRAFAGWPKSNAIIAGKSVIITEARAESGSGKPGSILEAKDRLIVACGKDALDIVRLKPVGKPEMSAKAFLAGYKHFLQT